RKRAVDYLKQRGLSGHIAKLYDIGFAPPGWNNLMGHLTTNSSEEKLLVEAGLVVENPDSGKRYDRFRDRITFPIRDSRVRSRKRAVDYLKQRGLSGHIAKLYDIGFAPPGWNNLMGHLTTNSSEEKLLVEAGLVVENPDSGKRYDRFRDRITFPIRDSRGRVIGFGGRVLGDDKPK